MNCSIADIAYALPETVLGNDDLRRENPEWDFARLEKRTGVLRRHVAQPGQTALDLGALACEKLFQAHPELPQKVDAIVFCTESADYLLPPNACVLHGRLGLPEHVLAFDVDLGCSGYPYCLGLARGMLSSRMASNVLLVNSDTYSKFIDKHDQSCRTLFGDGAAASWITACEQGQGILDVACGTAGRFFDKFLIPAGGCRRLHADGPTRDDAQGPQSTKPPDTIHMDGTAILAFVNSKVPRQLSQLLDRNGLGVQDVDLFVFHQASQMVLDTLPGLLKIRPEQTYSNLAEVGNTVSASIPIALADARDAGRLNAGDTVVLCGFGLGLSWASVLLKWT